MRRWFRSGGLCLNPSVMGNICVGPSSYSVNIAILLTFIPILQAQFSLRSLFGKFENGNPCVFPMPNDYPRCRIYDAELRRYNICDPMTTMSMDVVDDVIAKKLDEAYLKKDDTCICGKKFYRPGPCWYKFGFAFVKHLILPKTKLPSKNGRQLCSHNESSITTRNVEIDKDFVEHFGRNFARIIRERWRMGGCGEDILFLIVNKRPKQLSTVTDQTPVIFADWGKAVQERTEQLVTRTEHRLKHIITVLNENLEKGVKLGTAYGMLIDRYIEVLEMADRLNHMPRNKSHIPMWALASFGGCAVLLIVMGLGLFLVKTGVRRGPAHMKSMGEATRGRWKAGFVGGEQQQPHTQMVVHPLWSMQSRQL